MRLPKWLPAPLYNFLPSAYIIAGSLLAAYFPGGIGKPSALLMVWIGVVVFNMRLNNKR